MARNYSLMASIAAGGLLIASTLSGETLKAPACGVMESLGKLTLERCIEIGKKNNPDVEGKRWEIETSLEDKNISSSRLKPLVNLTAGYAHHLDDQRLIKPRAPGELLPFSDDLFSGRVIMTMPIDNTGKFRKEVESADYKYAAANHRFFRTRRELVFRITWTFFSILGQKELIGALEFSEKALEEHRTITGRLLKARKAATVDLLRTEVRLADIKQRQIKEKNLLNIQLFMLNNLLGLDTDASDLDISGDLVLSELPANLHEKARMACLHRHDYIALEALVSSREKRLQIAKAGYAPNLSFLASYGNTWSIGATTGDPSRSEDEGQVGMAMSVPLFTGGRIKSEIRRERNLLQTMKQELRKLKLQIKLEVETAQSNIESTRARVGVTEKAVEQAKESLRIEQKKHSVGKGAIIDVLDAQSALLDSQTNYYRALADYNSALAQFKLSLGER